MSITTKTINASDARTALSDAMADLMHVLHAEGVDGSSQPSEDEVQFALGVEIANRMPSALRHYRDEQQGIDGTVIEVRDEAGELVQ